MGILHQVLSLLDVFPEEMIAISVYGIGAFLILLCWYLITKPYSRFCSISTLILFAFFFTPTVSEGTNALLSPAIFGLLFGVVTKDQALMWVNLASILFVIGLGFIVGFFLLKFLEKRK
ncbi:hypothetical protein JK152_00400 [Acinetobacter nectaris]|nr:hypothetical protein [Acinetobacter nectaris]MCF8998695.1 hypothetical protein [Acinetobacter nectaris]MCF9026391.1 hypothetical protein [Acinetobacter nectaris]